MTFNLLTPCCETDYGTVANGARPAPNTILRYDPTRTGPLVAKMLADVHGRIGAAQRLTVDMLTRSTDVVGGRGALVSSLNTGSFQSWLQTMLGETIPGSRWDNHWQQYTAQAFNQGDRRSYVDVSLQRRGVVPTLAEVVGNRRRRAGRMDAPVALDDDRGVTSALVINDPLTDAAIAFISTEVFTGLSGITSTMSSLIVQLLTNGLTNGDSMAIIATAINAAMPTISMYRATVLVRTEIIKAYAEGQLNMLETLGVDELGVMVEYSTARDGRVCPLCAPMNGQVFQISSAHGIIPKHPQCRCCWIPAGAPLFIPSLGPLATVRATARKVAKRQRKEGDKATALAVHVAEFGRMMKALSP